MVLVILDRWARDVIHVKVETFCATVRVRAALRVSFLASKAAIVWSSFLP